MNPWFTITGTASSIIIVVFVVMVIVGVYLSRHDIYAILPTRLKRFFKQSVYNPTGEFRWRRGYTFDGNTVFHKEIEFRDINSGKTCWREEDDFDSRRGLSARVLSSDDLERCNLNKVVLTAYEMEYACKQLRAAR